MLLWSLLTQFPPTREVAEEQFTKSYYLSETSPPKARRRTNWKAMGGGGSMITTNISRIKILVTSVSGEFSLWDHGQKEQEL